MDLITWFSALQALMASVQVWQNERNASAARRTYEESISQRRTYEWYQQSALALYNLIDKDILDALLDRTEKCKQKFLEVLGAPEGKFFESDIDSAVKALKACICRELTRIADLNGGMMPTDHLQRLWNEYGCNSGGTNAKKVST